MEPQSQDQLVRAQYQGYQPTQYYRGDWTTTATPPTAQHPIEFPSQVPDHCRELQAAAAISAQGFHNDGYPNTNNAFLVAESTRTVGAGAERVNFSGPILASSLRHASRTSHTTGAKNLKIFSPQADRHLSQGNNIETHQSHPHEAVNYALFRHPSKEQYHLSHPSSLFQSSTPDYFEYPGSAMSLSYESQQFMADASYPRMHEPQEQEEIQHEHPRYPSPPMPSAEMNPYNHQGLDTAQEDAIENLPQLQSNDADAPSPGRSKPIPKPDREVTKGDNGRFVCTWVGCTEEVRDFGRKCEWSKHMDKHDRPYKCPAEGCEKLPGFTYSGGLLRHEREVHGKHGGPRKQLNCPHLNCKRHTGKGFSRQENLNEHLRRVHTSDGVVPDGAETEEEGEDTKAGMKRKRGSGRGGGDDIREELKRLRAENEELRRHSEAQTAQTAEMMAQIRQLQSAVTVAHPRMPNAPML